MHKRIVDKTGGSHGVRDVGLLKSAVERSRTTFDEQDLYDTLFKKAACYFASLVKHHVFVDGNKRIAFATTARFLFLNGYLLKTTNRKVVDFVLSIITDDKSVDEIAEWLKQHSEKV